MVSGLVALYIIGGRRKFCFGGQSINNNCTNVFGHACLIKVQRSCVALDGATAVRNKEMVENGEYNRF